MLAEMKNVDKKIRGRQVLGENLPPGDSDWGNLTIASQLIIADGRYCTAERSFWPVDLWHYGWELHERDKDV